MLFMESCFDGMLHSVLVFSVLDIYVVHLLQDFLMPIDIIITQKLAKRFL